MISEEYRAMRATIRERGTARMVLLPLTFIGWAATAVAATAAIGVAVSTVLPLLVLVAGFEAIFALHVNVERIGRYLQVYYEGSSDGPQWETTCMLVGPALPGGGVDPLFTLMLGSAALVNVIPALQPLPGRGELVVIAALHAAFLGRLARARWAAARQRAVELESYRAIRSGPPAPRV